MENLAAKKCTFVLSTGRTGTTFLTDLLKRYYPEVACLQEPGVGWPYNVCSNLHVGGRLPAAIRPIIRQQFFRTRGIFLRSPDVEKYIEINPFLYGLGDLLKDWFSDLRILHMIRSPWTCVPSLLKFKPRSWRRFFVNAPLWNLNVEKAKNNGSIGWSSLSWLERKAWQWVYINERIRSYQNLNVKYHLLRYEDLFTSDHALRDQTIRNVARFFSLQAPANVDESMFHIRVNPRASHDQTGENFWDPESRGKVFAICRGTMEKFGYSIE